MEVLDIGKIIKYERYKRGITQEELSYGICSVSTLSRIERGLQNPSRTTITSLFKRINNLDYTISSNSYISADLIQAKQEILYQLKNNQVLLAKETLDQLRIEKKTLTDLEKQTLDLCDVKIMLVNSTPIDTIHKKILSALHFTIKDFNEDGNFDYLLTENELHLLYSLAQIYKKKEDWIKSCSILEKLILCTKLFIPDHLKVNIYPKLLLDLCDLHIQKEDYKYAYELLKEYNDYCLTNILFDQLPNSAYFKAICELQISTEDKAKETVIVSYFTLLALGKEELAKEFKNTIQKIINVNFKIEVNGDI